MPDISVRMSLRLACLLGGVQDHEAQMKKEILVLTSRTNMLPAVLPWGTIKLPVITPQLILNQDSC